MARRGGDLEAFTAFLGGLVAAGLTALAGYGVVTFAGIEAGPLLRKAALAALLALWVAVTLTLYLRLTASARTRP
ncbi:MULTISPECIES: hypothetical protein [unclassified Kitasatospora]|uniref:hypothetical protein n=1 Tax=unclassified Kitasatospora TaxID=2633591 RepID=UPI001AE076A8|nr:hypothetical protein [Kitasatospora sp. RG8]MBP0451283.1 hypothetical protein [Kitasatospora sp. RG8]